MATGHLGGCGVSARGQRGGVLPRMGQLTSAGPAEKARGKLTWVSGGTVITEPGEQHYIGAQAHTNNTGELTAMSWALHRAQPTGPCGATCDILGLAIHYQHDHRQMGTQSAWQTQRASDSKAAETILQLATHQRRDSDTACAFPYQGAWQRACRPCCRRGARRGCYPTSGPSMARGMGREAADAGGVRG